MRRNTLGLLLAAVSVSYCAPAKAGAGAGKHAFPKNPGIIDTSKDGQITPQEHAAFQTHKPQNAKWQNQRPKAVK